MNKKLTIILPLLCLLSIGLIGQALGQTHQPGVRPEDYFVYNLFSNWSTSNSSLTAPRELVDFNNTLWFNVTVSYIQNNNVTWRTSQHFANNSDDNRLITMDLETGTNYFMFGFQGIFQSNLTIGDLIYPSGNASELPRINQTITLDYLSGKRDTNVVTITQPVASGDLTKNGSQTTTYYIDKTSGVLVERKDYVEFPDENGTETWKLTRTNLWMISPPPFELPLPLPILIAIVAVVVVAVVVIVVFRMRGNQRRRHRR